MPSQPACSQIIAAATILVLAVDAPLCGASTAGGPQAPDAGALRRSLEERLGTTVNPVDPRMAAALTDRIDGSPALLDALAPLVGLLVRDQEAA